MEMIHWVSPKMGQSEVLYLSKQGMKRGRLLGGGERACSLLLYGLWGAWRS
jgi:hypothetical protein